MQTKSMTDGLEHTGPDCCDHGHSHSAERRLFLVLIGSAFIINGYLARFLFPDNLPIDEFSAMIGALILAFPIFRTAIKDLIKGHLHMNELVALAVLASMVLGDFKTAGVVAFFMLISEVIETRTAEGARAAIATLIKLTPTTARRLLNDGKEEQIAAADVKEGDLVRVLPGENIPADGTIMTGVTTLNESTITGESLPRDKGPDAEVFAGTQNLTGAIEFKVTRAGQDTTLGKVRELILAAESTKLPFMVLIDRYVAYYTPAVLALAGIVWFFTSDWNRVISILVISCPCALILAIPTAMVAALSSAARLGILVKNVNDLESAGRITAMVFDKTGTLTTGQLGVSRLNPIKGLEPSELLYTAASAEQFSKHPASTALSSLAGEVELTLAKPEDFQEEPGRGISATIDGKAVRVGRASWLKEHGISDETMDSGDQEEPHGFSMVHVSRDQRYLGWIGMTDQLRPEAKESLEALGDLGVRRLSMVTGDLGPVAKQVAESIGCLEYQAECLPQQKVEAVHAIKNDGFLVAVVGDGVNDAPALAAGDIGIAMGAAGNDVAIHSATIALMNNDLRRLPFLLRLSRAARGVIHQNLGIGLVFIVGGLTLSGLGMLTPIIAALAHNVGSVFVLFNSARLIREGEELDREYNLESHATRAAVNPLQNLEEKAV